MCAHPALGIIASPWSGFGEAVKAAEDGAQSTCDMEALAGRANYVSAEALKGIPDPGAKAAAYALRALSGAFQMA